MRNAIKLVLACSLAVTLGACGSSQDASQAQVEDEPQTIVQDKSTDYTTGTPWLCADLDGVVTADTPADVKEDYNIYVNKDTILDLTIPEGQVAAGTLFDVQAQLEQDLKDIFVSGGEPTSHDAKLAYDMYQLMCDWEGRNALGMAPLKEQVGQVEAIDSIDALSDYLVQTPNEEKPGYVWLCSQKIDPDNADRYALFVGYGPRLTGDSLEYVEPSEEGQIEKDALFELLRKMLVKLGYSEDEAKQKLDNCWKFEAMLSEAIPTTEEMYKPEYRGTTNNRYSREELKELQGNIPILETFKAMGYPEQKTYLVSFPAYIEKLKELYTQENLALLKDYLIVHGAMGSSNFLDRECYEWTCEYNNAISGLTTIPDDTEAFSQAVSARMRWAVAQLYAERCLDPKDKERISELVDQILAAYHGILEEADWISDETRAKALEKLDAIDKRVLYPDSWEDYSYEGLDFASVEEGGTLWEAEQAINAFEAKQSLEEFSQPVNKDKWGMTPHTVNCCYEPESNSITITGAFAQGDNYNASMSDEELLGKLGMAIGHEISHAFDSTGAQYDKDGNLSNWWTEEDLATFQKKNDKLAAYLKNIHPWEGQNFRAETMTGEACADMTSMKCMLRIASQKPDFDYDEFFRSYAKLWLMKGTLPMIREAVKDVHPLCYVRVNSTLQQYDEFLDYYGIKEGDNMYLAPEDRVTIW